MQNATTKRTANQPNYYTKIFTLFTIKKDLLYGWDITYAMVHKWQDTVQSLFTACTTLQDTQRCHTSTSSFSNTPCQNDNISTANLGIKSYLQVSLQSFFAPLLGQDDWSKIALMYPSSGKLLGAPGDTT